MKVKLDENLGRRGAGMLRSAGHDVATVSEQHLCSSPDEELIKLCAREGRCLVTLDLGFGNPLLFPPSQYAGIAVLRLPSKPTGGQLLAAVETLVRALVQGDIAAKLWVVEIGRIREYQEDRLEDE